MNFMPTILRTRADRANQKQEDQRRSQDRDGAITKRKAPLLTPGAPANNAQQPNADKQRPKVLRKPRNVKQGTNARAVQRGQLDHPVNNTGEHDRDLGLRPNDNHRRLPFGDSNKSTKV